MEQTGDFEQAIHLYERPRNQPRRNRSKPPPPTSHEMPASHDVFIAYAGPDRDLAEALVV